MTEPEPDELKVRVAVRFRPLNAKEAGDKECVSIIDKDITIGDKKFSFDECFPSSTPQDTVFQLIAVPLLTSFFGGYNATILAYGQTGSGKTFTMGSANSAGTVESHRGIISRVIGYMFDHIRDNQTRKSASLKVSFIEIYNDEIRDLLDTKEDKKVSIREEKGEGVVLVGTRELPVHTPTELAAALDTGSMTRVTHSTSMNAVSSRSHAIFTIVMEQRLVEDIDDLPDSGLCVSKFHFVDLAGSERIKKTGAEGDRMKEGISINSGLLVLGNVISALGDPTKKASHVPYRDSKLTRILQDSLGGNSRTAMVACASPADCNFSETLSTLRYANRARNIQNKPVVNKDPVNALIRSLRAEITQLKAQLLVVRGPEGADINSGLLSARGEASVVLALPPPSFGASVHMHEAEKQIRHLQDTLEVEKTKNQELETALEQEKEKVLQLGERNHELETTIKDLGGDVVQDATSDLAHQAKKDADDLLRKQLSDLKEQLTLITQERDIIKRKLEMVEKILTPKQKTRIDKKAQIASQSRQRFSLPSLPLGLSAIPSDDELTPVPENAPAPNFDDPLLVISTDDDMLDDEEFVQQQAQEQHDMESKVMGQHYDALADSILLKEGLVRHVTEKAREYKTMQDDIGNRLLKTLNDIERTKSEINQVDKLMETAMPEQMPDLESRKENWEQMLVGLQKSLGKVQKEKADLEKLKDASDRKVDQLEREIVMMKKQRAEVSSRMRQEAKEWKKYKEEQRVLVSQLKVKVETSMKAADESKKKEKESQKALEEAQRAVRTAQKDVRQATLPRGVLRRDSSPSPANSLPSPLSKAKPTVVAAASTKKEDVASVLDLWDNFLDEGVPRLVELRLAQREVERESMACLLLDKKLTSLKQNLASQSVALDADTEEQLGYIEEELLYRQEKVRRQTKVLETFQQTTPKVPVNIDSLALNEARGVCQLLWEELMEEKVDREADYVEIQRLNEDYSEAQAEIDRLRLGRPMELLMFEEQKVQLQQEHEQQLWFFMNKIENLQQQLRSLQHAAETQKDTQPQDSAKSEKDAMRDQLWDDMDEVAEMRERKFVELQTLNEELASQVSRMSAQLVQRNKDQQCLRYITDLIESAITGVDGLVDGSKKLSVLASMASVATGAESVKLNLDPEPVPEDTVQELKADAPPPDLVFAPPKNSNNRRSGTASVYDRLSNPANFPAANPMGAASRQELVEKEQTKEEHRRKRDTMTRIRSKFEPVAVLNGHQGAVFDVKANAQNIIFSGSLDATLKMWDGQTQSLLATLEGHTSSVRTLHWSNNGFLVSGSLDRSIKVWDVRDCRCVHTLRHRTMTNLCTVVSFGDLLMAGSEDSAFRVFDIRKLSVDSPPPLTHTVTGHTGSVFAILKKDDTLFTGSRDHTIKVWNALNYKVTQDLTYHFDSVTSLIWLRGQLATASRDKSIKYFIEGLEKVPYSIDPALYPTSAHTDHIYGLLKTLDESVLLSCSKDQSIKCWDTNSFTCGASVKVHKGAVYALGWLGGDSVLLSASHDKTVRLFKHVRDQ